MKIIPAIDLLDGRVVRLRHGDFNERTFYDVEAAELAGRYHAQGAEWLHVVDLAASRDGEKADIRPLLRLLEAAPQSVQTGGGVRKRDDVRLRLDAGADRVVVGSICAGEPERFAGWLDAFGPERLVAALDVQLDEFGTPWPRTHGWTREAGRDLAGGRGPRLRARRRRAVGQLPRTHVERSGSSREPPFRDPGSWGRGRF